MKDKLMSEVWPNTFVEENNLTVNMSALRKALEEGSSRQSHIQTVPRRGYRFAAHVRRSEESLRLEHRSSFAEPDPDILFGIGCE